MTSQASSSATRLYSFRHKAQFFYNQFIIVNQSCLSVVNLISNGNLFTSTVSLFQSFFCTLGYLKTYLEACYFQDVYNCFNDNPGPSLPLSKGNHFKLVRILFASLIAVTVQCHFGDIGYHFPLRFCFIDSIKFDKAGKSFVQPKIIPPSHSNQVAEPL